MSLNQTQIQHKPRSREFAVLLSTISATDAAATPLHYPDILSFNLSQVPLPTQPGHQGQQIFAIQQLQKFTDKEGLPSVYKTQFWRGNEPGV